MTDFKEVQPGSHKNKICVECTDLGDIEELAGEMRAAALADIDYIDAYQASDSVQEALGKAKSVGERLSEMGHLRFISYRGGPPTNIVLTLMENKDEERYWHLSMSHGTVNGPQRVDDELADMIVYAFLEDGWIEVEPKAVFKTVRHFEKITKKV